MANVGFQALLNTETKVTNIEAQRLLNILDASILRIQTIRLLEYLNAADVQVWVLNFPLVSMSLTACEASGR
jgi:hypothetical protein